MRTKYEPWPLTPWYKWSRKGLYMTPRTGRFWSMRPIEMQANGKPCTKFVVPSVSMCRADELM